MGARGPGHIARLCARRPPAGRRGPQRRLGPPRRVRQRRGHRRRPRASSSRRCPTTAPPCSTPTTRGCSAWRRAPAPAWSPPAGAPTPTSAPTDVVARRRRPAPGSRWSPRGRGAPGRACRSSASTRWPTRCRPPAPPWPLGMSPADVAARAVGRRLAQPLADGGRPAPRRRHGRQRRLQRQPRVDAGRAGRAGRAARHAADRRPRARWPSWARTPRPSTSGWAATPPPRASTWSWPSGADAVGIADGAAAAGRRAGEESVHVPDRAAARELLADAAAPRRRRAGEGQPVLRARAARRRPAPRRDGDAPA